MMTGRQVVANVRKRVVVLIAMLIALFSVSVGIAKANELSLNGMGETHSYEIQIYAYPDYYTPDVTRMLSSRGSITANLSSTSGVRIVVRDGRGNNLASPRTCYKGSTAVFSNTYGGNVRTQPNAMALTGAHRLGGQWIYRDI